MRYNQIIIIYYYYYYYYYLFIYLFIPELNLEKIVQFFRNPFPAIGHRDPEKYIPLAANVECKHILNKAEP